jgi:hypothetical protein
LTSSDRNQSTKRHPAPPNSSTGSSQVKTREISIPPLTNTPSHKGQTQSQGNGPDPSKYAVDQKAPVPIPRNLRIMPNDTIRRPRIPSKSTMSNSRLVLEPRTGDPPSNLPASPLKKKQKSGQALY